MEEQTKIISIGKNNRPHYISDTAAEENGMLHRREETYGQVPGVGSLPLDSESFCTYQCGLTSPG